jgi:hypothetical protein
LSLFVKIGKGHRDKLLRFYLSRGKNFLLYNFGSGKLDLVNGTDSSLCLLSYSEVLLVLVYSSRESDGCDPLRPLDTWDESLLRRRDLVDKDLLDDDVMANGV